MRFSSAFMGISDIVVTGPDSYLLNLAENAKHWLCKRHFGSGPFQIGADFLSLVGGPIALLNGSTGSLAGLMSSCPADVNFDSIFGVPPGYSGGQCAVSYRLVVRYRFTRGDGLSRVQDSEPAVVLGPITSIRQLDEPISGAPGGAYYAKIVAIDGNGRPAQLVSFNASAPPNDYVFSEISVLEMSRVDGGLDNCGNPPPSGGQVIKNPADGDSVDSSSLVDNSQSSIVIPISFQFGDKISTLNVRFGDITIKSFSPLKFNVDVGGVDHGFEQQKDGSLSPVPVAPSPDTDVDATDNLLRKVLDQLKKPPVEFDNLYLPYVDSSVGCDIETTSFLVPRGSVSGSQVSLFENTAALAQLSCQSTSPEQLPESLIFNSSTTPGNNEVFSPEILPEVVSLRVKITDYAQTNARPIDIYPASKQYKFGSASLVLKDYKGGGDPIYIYDVDTYLPLPRRGKKSQLRLLLRDYLSFSVYDTGERLV